MTVKIQKLAAELNLQNMAKPDFGLKETGISNLEYLQYVLDKEMTMRKEKQTIRNMKESKMPKKVFSFDNVNSAVKWQIEEILKHKLSEPQNIVITGSCNSGKTALAALTGTECVNTGMKCYFISLDVLTEVMKKKESIPKLQGVFNRIKQSDVVIIDELFYTDPIPEDLNIIYKAMMFLTQTRKIIFVANRSTAEWVNAASDKFLMQMFIDRVLNNAEFLRLTR